MGTQKNKLTTRGLRVNLDDAIIETSLTVGESVYINESINIDDYLYIKRSHNDIPDTPVSLTGYSPIKIGNDNKLYLHNGNEWNTIGGINDMEPSWARNSINNLRVGIRVVDGKISIGLASPTVTAWSPI